MKQRSCAGSLLCLGLLVVYLFDGGIFLSKTTVSASTAHWTSTAPDIAGSYTITGTNEDGSPYKGDLEIIKRGDVYQFRWNAVQKYDGVGLVNGRIVAVAFTEGSDGRDCGVVSYQVLPNGVLDGKWGYWGTNEGGTEKALRAGGSGLAGNYVTTGRNPDGKTYTGKLAIAPEASGYKFVWDNNSSGFGIRQGDVVTVGIGGAKCAFVAYEIKPDGKLDGVWGGYGSNKTGTEKATRKN
jgi:hypothetical protein